MHTLNTLKQLSQLVSTRGIWQRKKLIHKYKKERDLIMTIDDNRTVGDEKDEHKSLHLSCKYK